jgi:hypothetical protein
MRCLCLSLSPEGAFCWGNDAHLDLARKDVKSFAFSTHLPGEALQQSRRMHKAEQSLALITDFTG